MDLNSYKKINGVRIITKINTDFSKVYIALRKKENRVLNDVELKKLPFVSKENSNYNEWKVRQKTNQRFIKYLENKKASLTILDIGCGNGWFTNKMAIIGNKVVGLDVNLEELEQARRVFTSKNLQFVYATIFKENLPFTNTFDVITLNACVQYFENFELLITTLKQFLKPTGEIHILDSPFYDASEVMNAKQRTMAYYTKIGFPEMAKFYFHHAKEKIKDFEVLYQPKPTLLNKFFGKKDTPFMWLKYSHNDSKSLCE